jgi:hypothetical protein
MAEAEYWRFTVTVARDCQKKNTSKNHSGYSLRLSMHFDWGASEFPMYLPF